MVSRELLDQVGGINKEYDGAQDYDFILRCTELADNVIHIPKVYIIGEYMSDLQQQVLEARIMQLMLENVR